MTPAQEKEKARLTPAMFSILRRASSGSAVIGSPSIMRSARILARRGFIRSELAPDEGTGWHRATLTPAGREAIP